AAVARLPHRVALQAGHGPHALLTARAPLDHALERLQRVDAVDLQLAARHHQRLADARPERQFQLRPAPGDRQAGPGVQREADLAGGGGHLKSPFAVVIEVFVAEDGDAAAGLAEDLDDALEQLVAR